MKLSHICAAVLAASALSVLPAQAALVEISFAGDATDSGGDIDYLPGETFSGSMIFETAVADSAADPNIGRFLFSLVSGEVITSRGGVAFDSSAVTNTAGYINFADQTQGAASQLFVGTASQFLVEPTGFSGSIDGLTPYLFDLRLVSQGTGDTFFTDVNALLSGLGSLSLDDFFAGSIAVSFTNGQDTQLAFGPENFSIRLLDAMPPSEVPIPGAVVLMASGLAGLGFAGRRKQAVTSTANARGQS